MKFPYRRAQFVPAIQVVSFDSSMLFFISFGKETCTPKLQNFSNFDKYSCSRPGQKSLFITIFMT